MKKSIVVMGLLLSEICVFENSYASDTPQQMGSSPVNTPGLASPTASKTGTDCSIDGKKGSLDDDNWSWGQLWSSVGEIVDIAMFHSPSNSPASEAEPKSEKTE